MQPSASTHRRISEEPRLGHDIQSPRVRCDAVSDLISNCELKAVTLTVPASGGQNPFLLCPELSPLGSDEHIREPVSHDQSAENDWDKPEHVISGNQQRAHIVQKPVSNDSNNVLDLDPMNDILEGNYEINDSHDVHMNRK
jgi:hypothetical protein